MLKFAKAKQRAAKYGHFTSSISTCKMLFAIYLLSFTICLHITLADSARNRLGVIGGRDALNGQGDSYVVLNIKCGTSVGLCGGCLIAPTKVLTAAHCAYGMSEIDVCYGIKNCTGQSGQCITATKFYLHPVFVESLYLERRFLNDICIIELPEPIIGIPLARLSALTTLDSESFVGRSAAVYGCGLVHGTNGTRATTVQFGCNTVTSSKVASKLGFDRYTEENNVIFARPHDEIDGGACGGDSGGPLFVSSSNKSCTNTEWFSDESEKEVIGIVSFGSADCESFKPIVYTFVPAFLDFIENPQTYNCFSNDCPVKGLTHLTMLDKANILSGLKNRGLTSGALGCKVEQILSQPGFLLAGLGGKLPFSKLLDS